MSLAMSRPQYGRSTVSIVANDTMDWETMSPHVTYSRPPGLWLPALVLLSRLKVWRYLARSTLSIIKIATDGVPA